MQTSQQTLPLICRVEGYQYIPDSLAAKFVATPSSHPFRFQASPPISPNSKAMNSTPTTPYIPLKPCVVLGFEIRHNIRLLRLKPGAVGSPIECSLYHTTVWKSNYEALSYEWGTEQPGDPTILLSYIPPRNNFIYEGFFRLLSYVWGTDPPEQPVIQEPTPRKICKICTMRFLVFDEKT